MPTYQVLVVLNQFKRPEIIENVKFFKTMLELRLIEINLNVAINIPINTNNDQHTIFYEFKGDFENPDIQVDGKKCLLTQRDIMM